MSVTITTQTSEWISSARRARSLPIVAGLFRPAPAETFAPRSRREQATPTLLNMLANWFRPAGRHCHRASCRRRTYCGLSDITGLPRCIAESPDEVFEDYARMSDLVTHFAERIRPGTLATWHGRFEPGPFGLRQRFCLIILDMALPDDHPLEPEFKAFWARERPQGWASADMSREAEAGAGTEMRPAPHGDTTPCAVPAGHRPMPGPECF
jgi:hypothetical protein